ncbi:MAG: nucleotidyltransferase domain-containing protein [Deltaproteobacteria bacterium]|nr:nucleotidyltransferase domain-containing protein [Deltaproteobacteria bacterium]
MLEFKDIADKYQLDLILIFGSRAAGDLHPESDIDIAVYGRQILSETVKIQLIYELGSIFHSDDVDLVDLRTASPLLEHEALKNYKILFQRDEMLLHQLESANMRKMKEIEILDRIRRQRLEEFIR